MTRTAKERSDLRNWSEQLSAQAESGQLEPIEGSCTYRGENAPVMKDDDLLAIFQGRQGGSMSIVQPSIDGIVPVTDVELDRAYDVYETDETFLAMVGRANTIPDYQPRQDALKQASRYALRKAINNVLKGRES